MLKKLYFKYEFLSDRFGNRDKILEFEIEDNKHYIKYMDGDNEKKFDITDKTDVLCEYLENIDIKNWDNQYFENVTMEYFPESFWELVIMSDNVKVECKGRSIMPDNWEDFMSIFYNMNIIDKQFP